ncbi:MAG TPA: hypothetical protein VL614_18580 [Acetobacteraceae bacterium]|jgi:hypothetical protein|nr:hypothetical protein [Acetobacteraceae bacterium]
MHDAIGTAGMLRGWVTIWTVQMVWPLLALVVSLGAMAIVEALMEALGQRRQQRLPLVSVGIAPCQDPPPG